MERIRLKKELKDLQLHFSNQWPFSFLLDVFYLEYLRFKVILDGEQEIWAQVLEG